MKIIVLKMLLERITIIMIHPIHDKTAIEILEIKNEFIAIIVMIRGDMIGIIIIRDMITNILTSIHVVQLNMKVHIPETGTEEGSKKVKSF